MKIPFDWRACLVLINGAPIDGFGPDDDSFEIDRDEDSISSEIGINGDMSAAITANRSGTITLKLLANASANTYLGTILNLEEGGPLTFVPVRFTFKDQSLDDIGEGAVGYCIKPPKITRGGKAAIHEWKFRVERLDLGYGGALNAPL